MTRPRPVPSARPLLPLIVAASLLGGCQRSPEPDPRMIKLREDIDALTEKAVQLDRELAAVRKDKVDLERKLGDVEKGTPEAQPLAVTIQQVEPLSEEKTEAGALYGPFRVKVTLKNATAETIGLTLVRATLAVYNHTYPKAKPTVTAKQQAVEKLGPGATREVVFEGFQVDHPGMAHALIVDTIPRYAGGDGVGQAKKLRLQVSFPPGSAD